jgi:GABA(A) receptor-associated protein
MNYKSTHSFQERKDETSRILEKYPDRIPIICEKNAYAKSNCPSIDKNKYLVPNDLTIGQFMYVIRKRLQLKAEFALFIFINGYIPPSCELIYKLYNRLREDDGYLYITYSLENTFGQN